MIAIDVGGARINVSSPPPGQSLPRVSANLHLGLDHFGLQTDDIVGLLASLQPKGLEILEPLRLVPSGARIAFVRAPDNVRIELMQVPG